MSTRSMIGMVQEDGSVLAIYCHWDGYVAYNGRILDQHYMDTAKVKELIALGDISSLNEEIGERHPFDTHDLKKEEIDPRWERWTSAYGRDRGETDVDAKHFASVKQYADAIGASGDEFRYLWDGSAWFVLSSYGSHPNKWDDVREAIEEQTQINGA